MPLPNQVADSWMRDYRLNAQRRAARRGAAMFVLLLALQGLDAVVTYFGVTTGTMREVNPVLAWLFGVFGVAGVLVAVKLAACALIGVIWALGYNRALALCAAFYVLGVVVVPALQVVALMVHQ